MKISLNFKHYEKVRVNRFQRENWIFQRMAEKRKKFTGINWIDFRKLNHPSEFLQSHAHICMHACRANWRAIAVNKCKVLSIRSHWSSSLLRFRCTSSSERFIFYNTSLSFGWISIMTEDSYFSGRALASSDYFARERFAVEGGCGQQL